MKTDWKDIALVVLAVNVLLDTVILVAVMDDLWGRRGLIERFGRENN